MEDVVVMEMRRGTDNKVVSRQFIDYFKSCLSISVNRKNDYLSGGYPEQLFEDMWNLCDADNLKRNAKILVVNDYALECVYELLRREFTNITILVTHDRVMHTLLDCLNRYYKLPVSIKIIELPEVCKMNEKFDLMIANPPYSCGNDVIQTAMKVCKEAVVLMPLSQYEKNKLHQHIVKLFQLPSDGMGAGLGNQNSLALLSTNYNNKLSFDQIKCSHFEDQYRKFYMLNVSCKETFSRKLVQSNPELVKSFNIETTVALGVRISGDGGIHDDSAFDTKYNLYNKCETKPTYCDFIFLNSFNEKKNMIRYLYGNPLSAKLIHGLNKDCGTVKEAIPHIDWSVDRDYEHLTLDDLINILKEENK